MANHNNQNQHCLDIREIAGAIGAEIYGVDLSSPISNDTFKAIHRAFLEYLVIFFPFLGRIEKALVWTPMDSGLPGIFDLL